MKVINALNDTNTNDNFKLIITILKTLAALSSQEESCRLKIAENKKFLDELLRIMKTCEKKSAKLVACNCFLSLSRSDKTVKSLILEAGEFTKELSKILIESDDLPKL